MCYMAAVHALICMQQMYEGLPEFLTEYKDYGKMTEEQLDFNDALQFFRGRNEHLVSAIKQVVSG